jgi:hypothetical protein
VFDGDFDNIPLFDDIIVILHALQMHGNSARLRELRTREGPASHALTSVLNSTQGNIELPSYRPENSEHQNNADIFAVIAGCMRIQTKLLAEQQKVVQEQTDMLKYFYDKEKAKESWSGVLTNRETNTVTFQLSLCTKSLTHKQNRHFFHRYFQ